MLVARVLAVLVSLIWLAAPGSPAWGTLTGLNQVPTPDIQPAGLLSVTAQDENDGIDSPRQVQLELGLSDSCAIGVFQGVSPAKTVLNAQVALVSRRRFLVSAGVLGTERSSRYLPFIEAGYYIGDTQYTAGVLRQDAGHFGFVGVSHRFNDRLLVIADYISGSESFSTVGVLYYLTPTLSFNPALYVSNASPRRLYVYASLTWDVRLW